MITVFCRNHSVHRLIRHGHYSLSSGSAVSADLPGTVLDYWCGRRRRQGHESPLQGASSPGTARMPRSQQVGGHSRWEALVGR